MDEGTLTNIIKPHGIVLLYFRYLSNKVCLHTVTCHVVFVPSAASL